MYFVYNLEGGKIRHVAYGTPILENGTVTVDGQLAFQLGGIEECEIAVVTNIEVPEDFKQYAAEGKYTYVNNEIIENENFVSIEPKLPKHLV
jgi:hypothetical protein